MYKQYFFLFSVENTHCILVESFKNVISESKILIVLQVWLLWFQSLNKQLKCLTRLGLYFLFTECLLRPELNYTKNITVIVLTSPRRDLKPALQRRKSRLNEVNVFAKGHRLIGYYIVKPFSIAFKILFYKPSHARMD